MYFFDTVKHHLPHVHAKYAEFTAVIGIQDSELIEGELPKNKMRLVIAWIEIHREELMADWELAKNGEQIFKIEPLK
ncbi:MAG: DUF4160 domain-containing protein [Bacteroidota bacterium]